MPLKKGGSEKTFKLNFNELLRANYSSSQAYAIAKEIQRKHKKKKVDRK